MGRKSKLKAQRREQQAVVEHTPDWTQHTQETFSAYVADCEAKGAESLQLLLTDWQNFKHLRAITKNVQYSIPVHIRFIGNENVQGPIQKSPF
jgi:hypothetical protein